MASNIGGAIVLDKTGMSQMQDCVGMEMSEYNACPHSNDASCCVHISCSPLAMVTSISQPSHIKPLSDQLLWATQDRPSPWIEDPTPPPQILNSIYSLTEIL